MEIISEALKEKNLSVEQLTPELRQDIEEAQNMAKKYNEACDDYEQLEEPDEETEKELNEMEEKIVALQEDIAKEIKALKLPEPDPAKGPEPQKEPEKSSSVGWLLLGGVALVVTLGVVNVFKKK